MWYNTTKEISKGMLLTGLDMGGRSFGRVYFCVVAVERVYHEGERLQAE